MRTSYQTHPLATLFLEKYPTIITRQEARCMTKINVLVRTETCGAEGQTTECQNGY